MTLEKLNEIAGGTLEGRGTRHEIGHATVVLKNITDSSVFISSNQEHINQAIDLGVKAIIYDNEKIVRTDLDTNWIKVDSIESAAFKITQYVISDDDASFYYLKRRELDFLEMITLYKRDIEYLEGSWQKVFERVLNSDKKIFISSDLELIKKLRPDYKILEKEVDGYIISDTLFRTTFRVGKYVYQHKEFSPIYFDTLLKVIAFCEENHQEYALDKLRYFHGFMPIFVDGEPSMNEIMKDRHIYIVCDDLDDIMEAIFYTKIPSNWIVKSAILTPPKVKIDSHTTPIWYNSFEDIVDILNNSNFNYAFIYSQDRNIANLLKKEYKI